MRYKNIPCSVKINNKLATQQPQQNFDNGGVNNCEGAIQPEDLRVILFDTLHRLLFHINFSAIQFNRAIPITCLERKYMTRQATVATVGDGNAGEPCDIKEAANLIPRVICKRLGQYGGRSNWRGKMALGMRLDHKDHTLTGGDIVP